MPGGGAGVGLGFSENLSPRTHIARFLFPPSFFPFFHQRKALTARFCRSNPAHPLHPPFQHQHLLQQTPGLLSPDLWLLAEKHPGIIQSTQLTTPRSPLYQQVKTPSLESARRCELLPLRRHKIFAVLEAFTPIPKHTEDISFRQVSLSIPSKWSSKSQSPQTALLQLLSPRTLSRAARTSTIIIVSWCRTTATHHQTCPEERGTLPSMGTTSLLTLLCLASPSMRSTIS